MVKIYISTVKDPNSLNGITIAKPNLQMSVDTFTGLKWMSFYANKNEMIKPNCVFFHKWKDMNIHVKIFQAFKK